MLFCSAQAHRLLLDPATGSPRQSLLPLLSCLHPQIILIQCPLTVSTLTSERTHSLPCVVLDETIYQVVSESFLLSSLNHQGLTILI